MTGGINENNVTAWLREHIPGLVSPVTYSLIAGGHSNLTYRCEDAEGSVYVLRRPPLGHVLQSAHDMGREHKIINALKDSSVPVARNYGFCQDLNVNEADFYVMAFIDGVVLNDSSVADEVGLGDLGRKEHYLGRQVKRWAAQWEASKTHEIPAMEECCRILKERMPEQIGAAIVHGDFRLGNMIVGDGEVKAVLDWELCTLGDPLADVGYLLNNWMTLDELLEPGAGDQAPTAAGGFISRDELAGYYESTTGRDLSAIHYYRAFSHWRLAAIGQGVYKRYLVGAMGESQGVDLDRQKEGVARRALAAMELLES